MQTDQKNLERLICSSGGDIFGEQHFDHSTSVTIIRFARATLQSLSCDLSYENSFESGKHMTDGLLSRDKAAAILVLTPGLLKINGARFAQGLTSGMKDGVKLFGGIAGDPSIADTWTLDNSGIHDHKAVGVGLYGSSLVAEMATKSGASPLGIERTITKAKGNIVHEVDGKPILSFYHQYLG